MGNQYKMKTHEEFMEEILAIRPTINITGKYQGCNTPIQWFCDKGHECYTSPKMLKKGYGCRTCKYISMKQNRMITQEEIERRIYDINPNIKVVGEYLGQKEKLECECLFCNTVFKITPPHKNSQRLINCPVCSDGISYPNKLIRNVLQTFPVENMEYEYSPDWAKPYYYDAYFQFNGNEYVVEMDGGFHFKQGFKSGSRSETTEDIQARDREKDKLAKEHNVTMIRIDARESLLDYIKENILSSKLSILFDFSNFNWMNCHAKSMNSDVKETCDLYNKGYSVSEIAPLLNHNVTAIRDYLHKGIEIGWCNYIPRHNILVYDKHTLEKFMNLKK